MNTDNIFFNLCHPILDKLKDGKVLKLGFAIFFYIFGVAALLIGLIRGVDVFESEVNIWTIILFLSLTFTGWMVFQICWYRAKSIKAVPNSDFVVSAIFAIFIRTMGEIIATVLVVNGFLTGLLALFTDAGLAGEFGVAAIVAGPILGFLIIALFYFIAERLSALPAIAVNTRNPVASKKTSSPSEDLLDN